MSWENNSLPGCRSSALAVNQALGNIGATILGVATDEKRGAPISDLAAAIKAGTVKTFFVLGGNPAYNAPADLDFSALVKNVPQSVRLGLLRGRNLQALPMACSRGALSRKLGRRVRLRRDLFRHPADDSSAVERGQRVGDPRAACGPTKARGPRARAGDFRADVQPRPREVEYRSAGWVRTRQRMAGGLSLLFHGPSRGRDQGCPAGRRGAWTRLSAEQQRGRWPLCKQFLASGDARF